MHNTEGIVLKKESSGETDALFTIYTKDFGKILARAQGIKKENAKLKGHLEPLNLSSVSFVLGRNGERLTQATMLNYWPSIRENFEKLRAAMIIVDLIDTQHFPGEKDEKMWELILASFSALEEKQPENTEDFLRNFRKEFAAVLGYAQ